MEIQNYEYKDIPGYEGLYAVTTCGKVWSYRRQKFLKPYKTGRGYYTVCLIHHYDKSSRRVHRLVMETFNPVEGMRLLDVNHLDEDKSNNDISNLAWTNIKDNNNYGTRNERIREYRKQPVRCVETGIIYDCQMSAADAVGLATSTGISNCCAGRYETAGGFHWERVDKAMAKAWQDALKNY